MGGGGGDRYAFLVEWLDPHAGLTFCYQLLYYLADGSIEMYDIKSRRTFLKRVVYPSVKVESLYVGSTITVYSRQLKITEYADNYTESALTASRAKTCCVVKDGAGYSLGKMVNAINKSGFFIGKMALFEVSAAQAAAYGAGGGSVVAMELVAENSVPAFLELLERVKEHFGQEPCYGSPTPAAAEADLAFFFGGGAGALKQKAKEANSTCCLIKPSSVAAGHSGQILDSIIANFDVSALEMFTLDRANTTEFYEVYKGVVPEYVAMVEELMSGPFIALEVRDKDGENPVEAFRQLCGPLDPAIGRVLRPDSLRAKFGEDKVRNAVHCTDLAEDGALENHFFFNILQA
eukprot:CAMPEP_0170143832 /NCGR_PEP_ID=MMETSP0033_2-20121228/13157_1 /TAXON_ID=195969 /ORGANISM="Dolichomastix tenuilepis, Strain CCMP3274" /LENGTH=347 /DNA_ID=CAMNT_0010380303 /DNA_START=20 /DNA_END=1063 /DNA_ORIENTATION=+